jgi:hypothetical protein
MRIRAVVFTTTTETDRVMFSEAWGEVAALGHPGLVTDELAKVLKYEPDVHRVAAITITVPDEDLLAILAAEAEVRGTVS